MTIVEEIETRFRAHMEEFFKNDMQEVFSAHFGFNGHTPAAPAAAASRRAAPKKSHKIPAAVREQREKDILRLTKSPKTAAEVAVGMGVRGAVAGSMLYHMLRAGKVKKVGEKYAVKTA